MPCYHPIKAYKSKNLNPKTGKAIVTFKPGPNTKGSLQVPCGQCIGCRLERSRIWAVRCMHEAQMHKSNYFLTLTYDDDNIPKDNSLNKRDLQLFYKRLRKRKGSIRYYSCGEYGDQTGRPHYHAIVFGLEISDKQHYKRAGDNYLYNSEELTEIWGLGHVVVGDVTFESCAYTARYIMKKQLGRDAWEKYCTIDKSTGEITQEVEPEFTTMSRRPGIGSKWYRKYGRDIFGAGQNGTCVIRGGIEVKPPRFYEKLLEEKNPEVLEYFKKMRKEEAELRQDDNTLARLRVKEKIKIQQTSTLFRNGVE